MGKYTRINTTSIINQVLRHITIVSLITATIAYNSILWYTGIQYTTHKRSTDARERVSTIPAITRTVVRQSPVPTRTTIVIATRTPIPVSTPTTVVTVTSSNFVCYSTVTQYYGEYNEQGTDFACNYRSKLLALWGGTVEYAGRTCWNTDCSLSSGGIVVIASIVPGLGLESVYYLHVSSLAPGITKGATVTKGSFIAYSGGQLGYGQWATSPAYSQGPHLEIGFDAYFICYLTTCYGVHTNPLMYIERAL